MQRRRIQKDTRPADHRQHQPCHQSKGVKQRQRIQKFIVVRNLNHSSGLSAVRQNRRVAQRDALWLSLRSRCEQHHRHILRARSLHRRLRESQSEQHQPELVQDTEVLAQIFEIHHARRREILHHRGELRLLDKGARRENRLDLGDFARVLQSLTARRVIQHSRHAPHRHHADDHRRCVGGRGRHQHPNRAPLLGPFRRQAPQRERHLQNVPERFFLPANILNKRAFLAEQLHRCEQRVRNGRLLPGIEFRDLHDARRSSSLARRRRSRDRGASGIGSGSGACMVSVIFGNHRRGKSAGMREKWEYTGPSM